MTRSAGFSTAMRAGRAPRPHQVPMHPHDFDCRWSGILSVWQQHRKVIAIAVTIRKYERYRYHSVPKNAMWDEPSTKSIVAEADVEVVAITAPDGSIRSTTRTILPSLLMTEEEDDEKDEIVPITIATSTLALRMNSLPCLVDDGTPALIRLQRDEDCSDSEDSGGSIQRSKAAKNRSGSSPFDKHRGACHPISSCHDSVDVTAPPVSNNDAQSGATTQCQNAGNCYDVAVHHHEDGTVGPYDCLSDQFTNMFCSVVLCVQPTTINVNAASAVHTSTTGTSHNNSTTTLACVDEGCSAYPLPNYYDESDFGFASMPLFWLRIMDNAGGKQDQFTISIPDRPHNRSSGVGPKQRSKHLEGIWKTWHAAADQEDCIPILERSKSLPDHLRATAVGSTASVYCYHFNLDPEQVDFGYDSDPEQDYGHRKVGRGKELINPQRSAKHQTPSYRNRRPQPIDTTMNVMTPTTKTLNDDSSMYILPPPPPPPRRCQDGPLSPAFSFQRTEAKAVMPDSKSNHTPTRRLRASLDPFSSLGPSPKDLTTPQGEMFLRTFIHEATNTKIPLIWHRHRSNSPDDLVITSSSSGPCPVQRPPPPMAVTCTFEVGAHLDQVVVQPKFTWCPTHEPHLDQHKIRLSGGEPHSIELLSIIRVIQPTCLNRELYPFARLDRTLCITTNDESFEYLVLEAESPRARDWLVNALKMIVARLASIIIVRDESMLLEFFTPFAGLMHLEEQQAADAQADADAQVLHTHHHFDHHDGRDDDMMEYDEMMAGGVGSGSGDRANSLPSGCR